MIDLQTDSKAITDFFLSSASQLKSEGHTPVMRIGILCTVEDGILTASYDNKPNEDNVYIERITDWDVKYFNCITFPWDESYFGNNIVEIKDKNGEVHSFNKELDQVGDEEFLTYVFNILIEALDIAVPEVFDLTKASTIVLQLVASDHTHEWKSIT
ncbi:hypothetical protein [Pelagicoccus sp. SDUM812005]|uniref:hypothetical protein n=1 Tax=Pelagicoccus sp. SDUM812005 TaxID=3041257 RepID=UPI0028105594|nr:hypothetical protein [Pelagicoccus sp. SDUM812005]MDQ8183830.1 hypothetical protein [Pelagicoccus sp. SDUM812005]